MEAEGIINKAMEDYKQKDTFVPYYNERNKLGRSNIKEVANFGTQEGRKDPKKLIVERAKAK